MSETRPTRATIISEASPSLEAELVGEELGEEPGARGEELGAVGEEVGEEGVVGVEGGGVVGAPAGREQNARWEVVAVVLMQVLVS